MKKIMRCFCLTLWAARISAAEASPEEPAAFAPNAVDHYLAHAVETGGITGLSVAMARDGVLSWTGTYGKSSLTTGAPVTTNTMFAIGSVTKQFTASCILLLAQDGKLSVQDKVAKYYPNLTRAADITLLDLMNHVSGYPDYYPLDFVDSRMESPIAADELIQRYAGGKLDFEPGTQYSYSNTGYVILGRIVEKVSGQTLGEFMTSRILRPVGMDHSYFGPTDTAKGVAEGHTSFALGPPVITHPEAQGWLDGAAGLNCTASDLIKWDLALISGRVLKAEFYDLMTRPRKLTEGRVREYGCGIGVKINSSTIVLSHKGEVSGYEAWNIIVPATHSAVAILFNCEQTAAIDEIKNVLANFIMPDPPGVPSIAGPDAGQAALEFLRSSQAGRIDRSQLGEEFSRFLSDDKVRDAAGRLKKLGDPFQAKVLNRAERGGMEVTNVQLDCKKGTIFALLYRTPDGKIQECLFQARP